MIDNSKQKFLPHSAFNKFLNLLSDRQSRSVLDLGCGYGRHVVPLAQQGYNVEGIDYSPVSVDIAQKILLDKNLNAKVSIADYHQEIKAINDSSYDAVMAVESLNYRLFEDYDIDAFCNTLQEINRILRTNGLLFIVISSAESEITNPDLQQIFFNEEQLKELLNSTFEIIDFSRDEDQNYVVFAKEK
jgi:SAM-dependent methyltransferase